MLLYELRIRARVTRLAKFTIDLSDVEPEVAGRDAILSQKAAVHALCKYKGSGGRRGRRCFPRSRCETARPSYLQFQFDFNEDQSNHFLFFIWNSLWKFKKKEWTIFRERVSDFSEVSFERIRLWISISLELRIWLKNFNRLTWSDWNDSLAMDTLARDTSFLNPREVNWFGSWLDEVNHRRGNHRFPPVYFHMHVRATSLHAAAARRVLLFPKEFAHVRGCVTYARAPWNFKRARRKRLARLVDREWKSSPGENYRDYIEFYFRLVARGIQFLGRKNVTVFYFAQVKILRVLFPRRNKIDWKMIDRNF